jgi:cystathionine beta-lyase/cystathionine gamma-synthase
LEFGADVVVHSTTKYLNGHSDSIGGALITNREDLSEWFAFIQKSVGAVLSPFEAFLVLRGTKTLALRMERHESNGRAVARFLSERPDVLRVYYPGLPDHPGREIQERQASGYGAMVSFELGSFERARRFLEALEVFSLAESLGGVESLACHPATMTHASIPAERRQKLGITDGLVRLSVGIEEPEDLLADLEQALEKAR